jgi:outer membrane protein insertion porin family
VKFSIKAQQLDTTKINYKEPKKYRLTSLDITGTQYLDKNIIRSLTGIKVGEMITVPGDEITKCLLKAYGNKVCLAM